MLALILCIAFYLIGAIPTGYVIGRLHGVTIWEHGSGNVGATNIGRVIGKRAGIMTLACDVLKGAIPITLANYFSYSPENLGCLGLFLVLGHCLSLPPYLRGGKGVATGLGVFLALSPLLAGLSLLTFIITMLVSRMVSLSSILAAVFVPIFAMLVYPDYHQPLVPWLMAISGVVIARHRENLERIIEGKEKKFEFKKTA